jgi:hypothetical protein
MGGKDGSPGGGVPARELWWRIPYALMLFIAYESPFMGPLFILYYLIKGRH